MLYFIDFHNNPFKYNDCISTKFSTTIYEILILDEDYRTYKAYNEFLIGYGVIWRYEEVNEGQIQYKL